MGSNEQQVRELAYHKWEEAGYPPGDGVNFWLEAEAEMKKGKGLSASRSRAMDVNPNREQPARAAKKSAR